MKPKEQKRDDILFVGIDLGTSRSSITASNKTREWAESYVGWPKDFISAKVIGKPVLFGSEALEQRLSLDLYRPLERGIIKEGIERNEEAVKELIGYLVRLANPSEGQKVYAIVGVPADAMKVNQLAIRKAVSGFADAVMVVSAPFAVAYGLNLLNNSLIIDIGAGTVDFCTMHGTIPDNDDQKAILTAGDYVDEQLFSYLIEKYPNSKFNRNMVRRFKEEYSFVGESSEPIQVVIPVDCKPVMHDITNEMRKACESILPAIIETTSEMIARFDPEFQVRIKNNIILSGGGSKIRGIDKYLKDALKDIGECDIRCVEDPLFVVSDGAMSLAKDMPDKYWAEM